MNSINDLKEFKKAYKSLYNRGIYAYKLQIIDEIECLKENEINEDDYLKLYNAIENAYLKSDFLSIQSICECAINNIDRLDEDTFNLVNESINYEERY